MIILNQFVETADALVILFLFLMSTGIMWRVFRVLGQIAKAKGLQLSDAQIGVMYSIVDTVVKAVEQQHGKSDMTSDQKRQEALRRIQDLATKNNVPFNYTLANELLEQIVYQINNAPKN